MITTSWFFGDEGLDDAHYIRRVVFIREQGISEADEMDGTDGSCVHLVAYDEEGNPVSTGRIMVTGDEFVIGRVATVKSRRGLGYGALVMRTLMRACFVMGGERQTVHAQVSARDFYTKLGFFALGEVYEEAGIPHITMAHEGDIETPCGGIGRERCDTTEANT